MSKLANSTSIFMASVTYIVLFSVMMFIIRGSALVFTTQTVYNLILTAVGALLALTVGAGAASIFGDAGKWVYQAGLLTSVILIFYFFMDTLLTMLPTDTPAVISFVLLILPFGGMSWVVVDKLILRGQD